MEPIVLKGLYIHIYTVTVQIFSETVNEQEININL